MIVGVLRCGGGGWGGGGGGAGGGGEEGGGGGGGVGGLSRLFEQAWKGKTKTRPGLYSDQFPLDKNHRSFRSASKVTASSLKVEKTGRELPWRGGGVCVGP